MAQTSVKIMQCAIAKEGQLKIDCIGVGVGIVLLSQSKKVAVGLHVLAAHSSTPIPENPAKFANSAIPHALNLLKKEGVGPPYTVAIAGGAGMAGASASMGMGSKVIDAVKEALAAANLKISQDETGGTNIRSINLNISTGKIDIK
jgi:chemotaxis protein CheD